MLFNPVKVFTSVRQDVVSHSLVASKYKITIEKVCLPFYRLGVENIEECFQL